MGRTKGTIKANAKDLARIKVMHGQGISENTIAKSLGLCNHTIKEYLMNPNLFNDSEVQEMIKIIKDRELQDLHTIGAKGRECLNIYLDAVLTGEKEPNPIAVMAIVDRIFQQRRLLEGASTHNVSIFSRVVQESMEKLVQKVDVKVCDTTEHNL